MKKFTALFCSIAILISCLLTGCGDSSKLEDSEYVGTWSATTCEYSGTELNVDEIVGTFEFTLSGDGTCSVTTDDGTNSGTWDETEGGVCFDGDEDMTFTDKDGTLFLDYDGIVIYFERQ